MEILNSIRRVEKTIELDLSELESQCFETIFKEPIKSLENREHFENLNEEDLKKILKEDHMDCSEKFLFDQMIFWIEKNKKKSTLDSLLKLIRFPQMSLDELGQVSNSVIARESPIFLELIVEAYQFQTNPKNLQNSTFSNYKSNPNSNIFLKRIEFESEIDDYY